MVLALCGVSAVAPAAAQVTTAPARWEIEGFGGIATRGISLTGSSSLPPPGPSLTTSSVLFPTRQTSSWFLGDGASLFNSAAADFGLSSTIRPLDDTLTSLGLGGGHASFGARVRRSFRARWALEFGVDISSAAGSISGDLTRAIEQARDSFTTAFGAVLATGPFTGIVVNAVDTRTPGSSREIAVTGAVNRRFARRGGFAPYATIGAGVVAATGDLPSASLEGDYRFAVLNDVPIHETDRIVFRYVRSSAAPLMVAGGGISRDVSPRWGWQIDGRVYLTGPLAKLVLDVTPTVAIGNPAGFVESLTNPNLQFSNSTSTGRASTLGGTPLQGFVAFDEGLRSRFVISVGVVRRF
jgi:hypothetical protein